MVSIFFLALAKGRESGFPHTFLFLLHATSNRIWADSKRSNCISALILPGLHDGVAGIIGLDVLQVITFTFVRSKEWMTFNL